MDDVKSLGKAVAVFVLLGIAIGLVIASAMVPIQFVTRMFCT